MNPLQVRGPSFCEALKLAKTLNCKTIIYSNGSTMDGKACFFLLDKNVGMNSLDDFLLPFKKTLI